MMTLAIRFEVDLPERPKSWRDWQNEKERWRREIRKIRAHKYQRRFYRLFFRDSIEAIADPVERRREAERVWEDLWPLAWGCAQ
jgi:hypothetical protein